MNKLKSWQAIQDDYNERISGDIPYSTGMAPQEIDPAINQSNYMDAALDEASNQQIIPDIQDLSGPLGQGVVELGQVSQQDFDSIRGNEQPQAPMSAQEKMMAEYKSMQDQDRQDLQEARSSDRNLKMGGAIGDALATYLNAKGQMNVKAPGVQVQQGAGLGKIADMFATAPDIAADLKSKREDLLAQFKQLQSGKDRDLAERRVKAYEDQVKASANKPKGQITEYQKYQQGEQGEKDVRGLKTDIVKSGLPRLTQGIADLEKQLGMPLEEAVARNTDKDDTNDVNVPGFGRGASLVPDVMIGDTGRDFRQAVQAVLNPDISKQYGATQSAGEIERYGKQIGSGKFESQDTVLKGLAALKRASQEDLAAIEGAYKPEVLDTYKGRGGLTSSSRNEAPAEINPDVKQYADEHFGGDYNRAFQVLKNRGDI